MKPSDLLPDDPAPQRALISSRTELHEGIGLAIRIAQRTVRILHRDLEALDVASLAVTDALQRLLLAHRNARVRMLVDDPRWLDAGAARLRRLQHRFPHALELRAASADDPVGDDACVLVDDHAALVLRPAASAQGDLWLHHKPHAQPLIAAFDRRWDAGVHNLWDPLESTCRHASLSIL